MQAEPRHAVAALPPELFAQIKAIQLRAQRLVTDLMMGEYESAFKGRGMEFDKVREYQPGDDVRHIDWNVTARMDTPYVREYHEDREVTAHFLLDVSPSVDFGTATALKRDLLIDFVAVLSRLLTRHGNRVGAVVYGKGVERVIPARGGRMQVLRLIDHLEKRPRLKEAPATSLAELLETANRQIPRRTSGTGSTPTPRHASST